MKTLIILTLSMMTFSAYSLEKRDPSYYEIKVGAPTTSTVTEKSFNTIPHLINAQHINDFKKLKIEVKVNLFWEKPWFTAWAEKHSDTKFSINFWGAVTRIPGMNDNGLALFACHEIGHIIGGSPRTTNKHFLWSSAEGQSDYFATSLCLKKYFTNLANLGKLGEPRISRQLYTRCATKYPQSKDMLICTNIMSAIEAMTIVFNYIEPDKEKINFSKKSPAVKTTNSNSYPETQCRVETLLAGNFCSIKNYPCKEKDNARPQCWFVD